MKKLHILFLSILPALVILFCFLGFLVAPNDPEKVVITQSFLAPCAEYPLGTDQYGRCVFSRILYGGYTTLGIVLMGSAIVMTVGILLGLLLGQGKAGRNVLFESILNAVTAIPPIAYLIIFKAVPPAGAEDAHSFLRPCPLTVRMPSSVVAVIRRRSATAMSFFTLSFTVLPQTTSTRARRRYSRAMSMQSLCSCGISSRRNSGKNSAGQTGEKPAS